VDVFVHRLLRAVRRRELHARDDSRHHEPAGIHSLVELLRPRSLWRPHGELPAVRHPDADADDKPHATSYSVSNAERLTAADTITEPHLSADHIADADDTCKLDPFSDTLSQSYVAADGIADALAVSDTARRVGQRITVVLANSLTQRHTQPITHPTGAGVPAAHRQLAGQSGRNVGPRPAAGPGLPTGICMAAQADDEEVVVHS